MTGDELEASEGHGDQVLGIVAEPDMPALIGNRLAGRLTSWLEERTGNQWRVEVVSDPISARGSDSAQILKAVERYRQEHGWTYAVCLTDLPLLLPRGTLLADASRDRRVSLVSAPALGGLQPYRRARHVLIQLLDDCSTRRTPPRMTRGSTG